MQWRRTLLIGLPWTPLPVSSSGKLTVRQRLVNKFIRECCWNIICGGRERSRIRQREDHGSRPTPLGTKSSAKSRTNSGLQMVPSELSWVSVGVWAFIFPFRTTWTTYCMLRKEGRHFEWDNSLQTRTLHRESSGTHLSLLGRNPTIIRMKIPLAYVTENKHKQVQEVLSKKFWRQPGNRKTWHDPTSAQADSAESKKLAGHRAPRGGWLGEVGGREGLCSRNQRKNQMGCSSLLIRYSCLKSEGPSLTVREHKKMKDWGKQKKAKKRNCNTWGVVPNFINFLAKWLSMDIERWILFFRSIWLNDCQIIIH